MAPTLIHRGCYVLGIKIDYKDGVHVTWRCKKRNHGCKVLVYQVADEFTPNCEHTCPSDPSIRVKVPLYAQAKIEAMDDVFKAATEIVDPLSYEAYKKLSKKGRHYLPRSCNVIRATNRARARIRPVSPTTAHFSFNSKYLPKGFVREPIDWTNKKGQKQRIVILTTRTQLKKLAKARRWEVDATFSIVSDPFYQLFGIHTTVRKGNKVKSIPLAFALMTSKTKLSYVKLFRGITELLEPYGPIRVARICVDFESAVWGAIRNVFPSVKVQGCGFHFYQAIFRKIQELGLSNLYRTNRKVQHTCRKLMTLNLLPNRFIPEIFYSMKANSSSITRPLFQYFEKNWLKSKVWGQKSWSVFYLPIRTNNPVESYHSRLK